MNLKVFKIILIFILLISKPALSNSNFLIKLTVDNEIITNFDLIKEGEYLKLLNNNLQNLNEKQITQIAKENLINEIIKKKEIQKLFDLDKENPLIDKVLVNLYEKIGFKNQIEFENTLKQINSYNIDEITKKLKIEIYWNDLIFLKYKDQVKINEKDLKMRLNNQTSDTILQYFLSEIVFEKKINTSIEYQINQIKQSILEIGFNNTANLYSISNSSKFGGKVGWIDENNLSELIINELRKIEKGEITNIIQISNNYLILKIEDIKTKKINLDKDEELKKLINFERNEQLNRFSNIFFNKAKINYSINEN